MEDMSFLSLSRRLPATCQDMGAHHTRINAKSGKKQCSTGHLAEILCPSHSPKFLLVFRVAFCGVSCSANSVHKDCKTRIGAGRKSKVKIDPTHPRTDNLATLSARQAAPMLALLSTLNLGYNLHSAKNNQSPGYWNSC